jgi:DNA helicase-2/ATP-dependent DNA helicase PcrA
LEQVSLVTDTDKIDPTLGAVTLMTLHSAKGLEFDRVFITGMEEGLFPHGNSLRDESGLEEERRLCYVGLTRAREKVCLSSADSRRVYGSYRACIPSRFLKELPQNLLNHLTSTTRIQRAVTPSAGQTSIPSPANSTFPVGIRVHHPLWGIGTITQSGLSEKGSKVTVRFQRAGSKKLIAELAGLKRL